MPRAKANGIEIEYEVSGPHSGAPLLLIHGVGAQLIQWPETLYSRFENAGFRVIRYDCRDVGLSTRFDAAPVPDVGAVFEATLRGETPSLPYTVSDLAADAAGLLDALGVAKAHVLGVSLGGQVAQALATEHPGRVTSLTVMMTYSGNPAAAPSPPTALANLTAPAPPEDAERFAANAVAMARAIGSPDYPADAATIGETALRAARRAHNPRGVARLMAAGRGAPDRRPGLRKLSIPVLVIHGVADPLVPVACGQDIAENIPAALMMTVNGMGHDLPAPLFDVFVDAVAMNARRAGQR